jgi:hypothetical protein
MGRFISEDPSGFDADDPNLYRYVGNDPVNNTDPTGMFQAGNPLANLQALLNPTPSARTYSAWSRSNTDWTKPIFDVPTYAPSNDPPVYNAWNSQVEKGPGLFTQVGSTITAGMGHLKTFGKEVGRSFADGRAWDSVQGAMVEFADSGADLLVGGYNAIGRAEYSVLNTISGRNVQFEDVQRSGRLSDYVAPLYGHSENMQQGQVVGHYTARAQAAAATAWGGAQLAMALPGVAGTLFNAGAGLGAGLGMTSGGSLVLVPSMAGGVATVGAGALGVSAASVGILQSGALDPLANWVFMSAPKNQADAVVQDLLEQPGVRQVKSIPGARPGTAGHPDHLLKVSELEQQALLEAGPGERVLVQRQIQNRASTRVPDVQIVDPSGRTRKVFEAERLPNSSRNFEREAEYRRLGLPFETHPLD